MDLHLFQYESSLVTRELLFIGFEGNFDSNIRNYPYQSDAYQYAIENNAGKAYQWLEQRVDHVETFQLPFSIFCNLEWLSENNFEFAEMVQKHPFLRYIPLIALTNQGVVEDKSGLTQKGVDDCYTIPVEWDLLEARLSFLNQFKPKIIDEALIARLPKQVDYNISISKRIFDLVAATIGIILSAPAWISIAIAIRLESKGPVIYRSKRVGAGYHIFDFFKFRSMYADADQRLHEFQHLNQYRHVAQEDGEAPIFVKITRDPRVTRVGRFIRKYSLDELPQLINVLLGDMSMVGNRPLPIYEAELLVKDEYCERFLAPAGLTGLWQVTKRGHADMSMQERIALDIAYSKNTSIWTDLNIILKTFGALVQKEDV